MKLSYDLENILFKLLSNAFNGSISGEVYKFGDRPTDSTKEDVVIQTNYVTQEYLPQVGSSTLYVYIPDQLVTINGIKAPKPNRKRLEQTAKTAVEAIRNSRIDGLKIIVDNQVCLRDFDIKQHLTAIRLTWNIQTF